MRKILFIIILLASFYATNAQDLSVTSSEIQLLPRGEQNRVLHFPVIKWESAIPSTVKNGTIDIAFSVTSVSDIVIIDLVIGNEKLVMISGAADPGTRRYTYSAELLPGSHRIEIVAENMEGARTALVQTVEAGATTPTGVTSSDPSAFEITGIEQDEEFVTISYNMNTPGSQGQTVSVYTSANNFSTRLKGVTGDVHENVPPGPNKKIVWNMVKDYGENFATLRPLKLKLELRTGAYKPDQAPLSPAGQVVQEKKPMVYTHLVNIQEKYTSVRRGHTYPLNWTFDKEEAPVFVDLLRNGELVARVQSTTTKSHLLDLKKSLKTGTYQVRVVSQKDETQATFTNHFKVTPKIPLYIKLAPVVVAGVVVYIVTRPGPPPPRLPDPALPGD